MSSLVAGASNAIPDWFPDETLFSLISRYHFLSGNRLASSTNLALFGHVRSGWQHDFPSQLSELCKRTQGVLGTSVDLSLNRTIIPFYLPLRDEASTNSALASLIDQPQGMLKYRLGILTSRFRANHPLKACPICMSEDIENFGTPYWHRTHQFPGVWICPQHGHLLRQATVKSTGVGRFGWVLPQNDRLSAPIGSELGDASTRSLNHLAAMVKGWASLPAGTHLSLETLSRTYRSRLPESAWHDTSARRSEWARAYQTTLVPLRVIPELVGFPETHRQASLQLDRWLFSPRGNTHPLRQLSLIMWLFPDWQTFWQKYLDVASSPSEIEYTAVNTKSEPVARYSKLLALLTAGRSATAAAAELGIDVGTAIAWAAKQGISTARRAKVLKPRLLAGLIADLRAGVDKPVAAQRHGVSIQAITRLLRSEVGLQDAWHAKRFSDDQERARSAWLELAASAPGIGVTALRAQRPWAYAWLYRNDRDWLGDQTRRVRLPRAAGGGGRVDWDSRDTTLADEILRVASDIANSNQSSHVSLWQLYQVIPELKAKLGAFDRLPLTRAAIESVIRARRRRPTSLPLI
ncbi:MAG: TnsD family Tn7-like transposition protein [Rhodoferax sp.]|uniref:TnsD family Tn7-like transposition protein n=1 Tax=Rhodoferax sp. TaxID=50421 RepID=UPI003266A94D